MQNIFYRKEFIYALLSNGTVATDGLISTNSHSSRSRNGSFVEDLGLGSFASYCREPESEKGCVDPWTPDHNTIWEFETMLGEQGLQEINDCVLLAAAEFGFVDP